MHRLLIALTFASMCASPAAAQSGEELLKEEYNFHLRTFLNGCTSIWLDREAATIEEGQSFGYCLGTLLTAMTIERYCRPNHIQAMARDLITYWTFLPNQNKINFLRNTEIRQMKPMIVVEQAFKCPEK